MKDLAYNIPEGLFNENLDFIFDKIKNTLDGDEIGRWINYAHYLYQNSEESEGCHKAMSVFEDVVAEYLELIESL